MEELGHDVAEFSTMDDVRTELGRRPPDVMLVDLTSGRTGGIRCVREVRRDHDVPILLLGIPSDTPRIVAALEAGADDYVTEPFEIEEVTARLRTLRRRVRADRDPDGLRDVLLEAHPHDPLVLSPHSEDPASPRVVVTVRGFGYRLDIRV